MLVQQLQAVLILLALICWGIRTFQPTRVTKIDLWVGGFFCLLLAFAIGYIKL